MLDICDESGLYILDEEIADDDDDDPVDSEILREVLGSISTTKMSQNTSEDVNATLTVQQVTIFFSKN